MDITGLTEEQCESLERHYRLEVEGFGIKKGWVDPSITSAGCIEEILHERQDFIYYDSGQIIQLQGLVTEQALNYLFDICKNKYYLYLFLREIYREFSDSYPKVAINLDRIKHIHVGIKEKNQLVGSGLETGNDAYHYIHHFSEGFYLVNTIDKTVWTNPFYLPEFKEVTIN